MTQSANKRHTVTGDSPPEGDWRLCAGCFTWVRGAHFRKHVASFRCKADTIRARLLIAGFMQVPNEAVATFLRNCGVPLSVCTTGTTHDGTTEALTLHNWAPQWAVSVATAPGLTPGARRFLLLRELRERAKGEPR